MAQLFYIADLQLGPFNNEAMNRYWYYNNDANVGADDVAVEFADVIMDSVRTVQSQAWAHVAIYCEDWLQPSNAHLLNIIDGNGGRSLSVTPAFNQWSFPLKPVGPTIKRGGKRIGGVAEPDTSYEEPTPGMETILQLLALVFAANLGVDSSILVPAIVRVLEGGNEAIISPVVGAIFRQIGSQVSRKFSEGGGTSISSLVPASVSTITSSDFSTLTEPQIEAQLQATIDAQALLGAGQTIETQVSR